MDSHLVVAGRLAGLERLIAGTAHEINNPLTSVQGLASLLLMDADDAQTREDLEVIAAETERAVVVIRNLRSFVQRGETEPQPCDLNTAVRLVTATRGYELRARSIELALELPGDLPPVVTVHEDLLHLILQLILDAEDALLGAAGGTIADDSQPTAMTLELATAAAGPSLVIAATYDGARLMTGTGGRGDVCAAMARELGGSHATKQLPDGRVRTTVLLPAAV
jgi:two-component system NtrC family sensor kinase